MSIIKTKMRSKYGLRIRAWDPEPGKPLPMPIVEDDRATLPIGVVKHALAWLEQRKPEFLKDREPTPVLITMGQPIDGRKKSTNLKLHVRYGKAGDPPEKIGEAMFTAATYEMLLRSRKRGLIQAKYTYLVARDQQGRTICGPYLHNKQTALITLAS